MRSIPITGLVKVTRGRWRASINLYQFTGRSGEGIAQRLFAALAIANVFAIIFAAPYKSRC